MTYKKYLNTFIISGFVFCTVTGSAFAQGDSAKPAAGDVPTVYAAPKDINVEKTEVSGISFDRALMAAYQYNPTLAAARAELRSVDETYAQAMSGYRPRLNGIADYTSSHDRGDVIDIHSDSKTLALELQQPLYRGGSTEANMKSSHNRIKAQRAVLHATEQGVLLDAVTVYMDVVRDTELLKLNANNENVLAKQLDAARKRFDLGDITKTDVSQSEARLAKALASRVTAEGNLQASKARFARVIGTEPKGMLGRPLSALNIPASVDDALVLAENKNPDLHFARFSATAARYATRSVIGELLPQVDLTGSIGRTYDPALRTDDEIDSTTVGVRATMPFYTGGGVDSRARQARQVESQRRMELHRAERAVRQEAIDAWAALSTADAEMVARQSQIEASKLALDGVRIEADYGSRTTLDLLDAEQEYLDAQTSYVIAERNKIVALYRVKAAIGELTAGDLGLDVVNYDPKENFQKVKNRWIGTHIDE
jgi:outer membrane protein/adhesin transport system outer membrane protein